MTATMYRMKLGHDEDFANAAKAIYGGYAKANIEACILAYQVTAGAAAGTYILFNVMGTLKDMDGAPQRMMALKETMGDEYGKLLRSSGNVLDRIESTLFRVSPGMSYPMQETIDADPAFWKPKPVMAAKAAPEKKSAQ
jgi:hypothetical protein